MSCIYSFVSPYLLLTLLVTIAGLTEQGTTEDRTWSERDPYLVGSLYSVCSDGK